MTLNDATKLVGRTGANQLLILAKNKDKVRELTNEYMTNTTRLDEMVEAMGNTTHAKIKKMSSAIEGMKLEFGALIADALLPIINKVTQLAASFTNLDEGTKKTIIIIAGIAAAIGPMLLIVAVATTAYGALGTAIGFLVSPIGLAIAALVLIPIALKYIIDNWEAFAERLGDWSWWKNAVIQVLQWLLKYNPFSVILKGAQGLYDFLGIESKVYNPFEELADSLEDLKEELPEYEHEFGNVMDSIKDGLKNLNIELPDIFGNSGTAKEEGEEYQDAFIEGCTSGNGWNLLDDYFENKEYEIKVTPKMKFDALAGDIASGMEGIAGKIGKFMDTWGAGIEQVGAIFSQNIKNQSIALDNENALEEERINKSAMSEEQKETALQTLHDKTAKKQLELKRKQAKVDKAMSVFNLIAATAEAVMKAAPNPYAMIAMGVLGATQIAMVASQPLPAFAEGGLVTGATMGLVGEGRGTSMSNPEVIAPLDKLKSMLGDSGGGTIIPDVRISGDDLLIVFDRATRRKERR